MNKRGAYSDLFLVLILAFAISVILGLLYFSFNEIEDKMLEKASVIQGQLSSSENVTKVVQNTFGAFRQSTESLKWISVMLIVGLFLSAIIHSFLINSKPVFWISYFFLWMLCLVLAFPISNVYEEIYTNPELSESFAGFVGQNYLMLHIPTWILIVGFLCGILMFVNFIRVRSSGGFQFG